MSFYEVTGDKTEYSRLQWAKSRGSLVGCKISREKKYWCKQSTQERVGFPGCMGGDLAKEKNRWKVVICIIDLTEGGGRRCVCCNV